MSPIVRCLLAFGVCAAAWSGTLRVGAARIDITPAADAALPMAGYGGRTQGFRGIHDPIYVRAIVLDDGTTQIALVVWEPLFVPDAVWAETSERIAAEDGIKVENLMLSAVHNHGPPPSDSANRPPEPSPTPGRSKKPRSPPSARPKPNCSPRASASGRRGHTSISTAPNIRARAAPGSATTRTGRRTRPSPCCDSTTFPASRSPSGSTTPYMPS